MYLRRREIPERKIMCYLLSELNKVRNTYSGRKEIPRRTFISFVYELIWDMYLERGETKERIFIGF